jgi:hypothetical protein
MDLIKSLFDQYSDQLLFFASCSDEQAAFAFDFKVLPTAPVETILDRLGLRTTNPFGKTPAERDRVLADMEWVLPLLCASADLVIEATRPTDEVADTIIDAVVSGQGRSRQT